MNHARLSLLQLQLRVLLKEDVLSGVHLLRRVAVLCDGDESHLAVLVDDHAADFGERAFAASGCFGGFEEYGGRAVPELGSC